MGAGASTEAAVRVVVVGAAGKMGRGGVRAVSDAPDLSLVGACDRSHVGEDAGTLAAGAPVGINLAGDLGTTLAESRADAIVDFTVAESAVENIETALRAGAAAVVGTTGIP